jgi:hypothetical protein
VNALKEGADFAKGSRFMPGAGSSDISRVRQMGNYWLNKAVNLLYGTRYTDLCYGYNAFRRECLSVINLDPGGDGGAELGTMLWGDGFEVETLINVRIAKAGLHVFEVPSFERSRYFGTSNLNAFSDGMRVLRTIHVERKQGARRQAISAAGKQRNIAGSWSVLSTFLTQSMSILAGKTVEASGLPTSLPPTSRSRKISKGCSNEAAHAGPASASVMICVVAPSTCQTISVGLQVTL